LEEFVLEMGLAVPSRASGTERKLIYLNYLNALGKLRAFLF